MTKATRFCRDESFVATKESVCCDRSKLFIATKMILAAALANDTERLQEMQKAVVQPAVQYQKKKKKNFFFIHSTLVLAFRLPRSCAERMQEMRKALVQILV